MLNSTTFGKVAEFSVDGQIGRAILYLHQVTIPRSGQQECALLRDGKRQCVRRGCGQHQRHVRDRALEDYDASRGRNTPLTTADTGCGYIILWASCPRR